MSHAIIKAGTRDRGKISWDAIGSAVWTTLHTFVYSVEDSRRGTLAERLEAFCNLVSSIQRMYPCITCYTNLNGCHRGAVADCDAACHRTKYASAVDASNALALWVFRLHNTVTRWKMLNYDDEPINAASSEWVDMESPYMSTQAVLRKLRERWSPHESSF